MKERRKMTMRMWFLGLLALFLSPNLVYAQPTEGVPQDAHVAAPSEVDPLSMEPVAILKLAVQAVRDKNWKMLGGLVLILFVAATRKWGTKFPGKVGAFFVKYANTSYFLSGIALVLGMGSALVGGVPLDLDFFAGLGTTIVLAGGGWHMLLKPLFEKLGWYESETKKLATEAVESRKASKAPPGAGFSKLSLLVALTLLASMVLALYSTSTVQAVPASSQMRQLSEADVGIDGVSINSNTTSKQIVMHYGQDIYTQLSLHLIVTWGTTALMNITCEGSVDDGGSYAPIQRCVDGSPHTCAPRAWQLAKAGGETNYLIDLTTSYSRMRCTFDDPAAGDGTLVARAMLIR